jgi:hypothetical protein
LFAPARPPNHTKNCFRFAAAFSRSDQVGSRLDVQAVKRFLGDPCRKFETANITTVIRIRAVERLAAA